MAMSCISDNGDMATKPACTPFLPIQASHSRSISPHLALSDATRLPVRPVAIVMSSVHFQLDKSPVN